MVRAPARAGARAGGKRVFFRVSYTEGFFSSGNKVFFRGGSPLLGDGLHSGTSGFISTFISLESCLVRSLRTGFNSKGVVYAPSVTVSCRRTSMGCTPDVTAHSQLQSLPLPSSLPSLPPIGRLSTEGAPSLSDVSTSHSRLGTSIPANARDLWSKCLIPRACVGGGPAGREIVGGPPHHARSHTREAFEGRQTSLWR